MSASNRMKWENYTRHYQGWIQKGYDYEAKTATAATSERLDGAEAGAAYPSDTSVVAPIIPSFIWNDTSKLPAPGHPSDSTRPIPTPTPTLLRLPTSKKTRTMHLSGKWHLFAAEPVTWSIWIPFPPRSSPSFLPPIHYLYPTINLSCHPCIIWSHQPMIIVMDCGLKVTSPYRF